MIAGSFSGFDAYICASCDNDSMGHMRTAKAKIRLAY